MAIDAKCPFCEKGYRLKDDLVGKKVTCANQGCRKVFTVTPSLNGTHAPEPATVPPTTPAPKSRPPLPNINSEDLAAAALNDDPDEVPEDQKTIEMKCTMCDHAWPVAWAMQGKNVLCPECKHRQKVPLQAKGKKGGWREQNVPEGVKQEKLENVVSARDNKMVSGTTLIETGAVKIDYDDLPNSVYWKWAAVILVPILLLAGGIVYWMKSKTTRTEEQIPIEVHKTLEAEEMAALPLYRSALQIAAGEYEARNRIDPSKARDKAIEFFRGALADLNAAPKTPDREQLYGELAVSLLTLGGEGEDVMDKRKLSWLPPQQNAAAGAKVKPNPAELEGVQGQVRRVLAGLKDTRADFEVRAAVLRRLCRELLKVNQLEVVRSTLPALFDPAEQYEAEGQIGLECFRANKTDLAKEIAEKFKKSLVGAPNPPPNPAPASVQALWILLDVKGPTIVPAPSENPSDASRWTYTAVNLLKGNREEARATAIRTGKTNAKLVALALAAEWADKPGEFLEAAETAVKSQVSLRDPNVVLAEGTLLRLAQMAARAGAAETAEEFIKPISNEFLKPFAKAEVLRNKLAAEPGLQPKDDDAELSADVDPKKLKLGAAWGRLALARHNAMRTRDKSLGSAYARTWPKNTIAPFGQIGVLLGLQDAERK